MSKPSRLFRIQRRIPWFRTSGRFTFVHDPYPRYIAISRAGYRHHSRWHSCLHWWGQEPF